MFSKTSHFRYLALFSHIGLLCWVIVWHFFLRDSATYSPIFIFIIYVLPLLLPLHGVVKGKPYTHAWANFIVMFYLLHGLTILYAEPHEWVYAVIELMFVIGMFVGCAVYARKRGKELGEGLPKLKSVMEEERQRFERG
ncbi:DUF2069 domain-containing protein [Alteromonas oceanisediminis]|uniref:DUF2069 domain-containing protein n=1 Tax=Alteromonas oceanisediminis TaxID=2836180 RepID=UPI001BDAB8FC|nr:DUF2069 domain-containing protein [Alteromonas oceanisediminis]MBT0586372.1 DUF2069 domain-containing protein [Alteromonas oceanisediminis]